MPTLVRLAILAAVSLLTSSAALAADSYPNTNFGAPFSNDESWYRQCMRVADLGAPQASGRAAPSPQCDASALYYSKLNQAATPPAEWQTVRACASAKADSAVLMMLYANGFGVPRDVDLALHYACQLEAAKAEMEARVAHLAAARGIDRPFAQPFDQCDDITSGYMEAVCAAIRETQDERVRVARLERIGKALTPAGRAAFAKLRAAAERYAAQGSGEVDMQGSGAPARALQRQARLREQFMQAALDAVNGKLPSASAAAYAQQDSSLNDAYQAVMNTPSTQNEWPDRIGVSTISRTSVRGTERLWLAYRDAFAAFAATLRSADPVAVKTLLAGQRTAQLAEVARDAHW